jgi:hypothetical protein
MGEPEESARILSTEELDEWCSAVVRGEVGEPETDLAGQVVGEAPPKLRDRIAAAKMLYQRRGAFVSRSEVRHLPDDSKSLDELAQEARERAERVLRLVGGGEEQ